MTRSRLGDLVSFTSSLQECRLKLLGLLCEIPFITTRHELTLTCTLYAPKSAKDGSDTLQVGMLMFSFLKSISKLAKARISDWLTSGTLFDQTNSCIINQQG